MRNRDRAREIVMFLGAAMIATGSALGAGEIRTEIHSMGVVTTQDFDAGAAITLTIDGDTDLVNIYDKDTGTLDDIGRVTINGTNTNLQVFIGDGSFPANINRPPTAGDDFAGLTFGTDATRKGSRFAGRASGNLTNSVNVGYMYRFEVEGQIQAEIKARTQGAVVQFRIHAGGISSAGSVVCTSEDINGGGRMNRVTITDGDIAGPITADGNSGRIDLIQIIGSTGGDLLADISADTGELDRIEINGDIGTATNPVSITAGKNLDSGQIFRSVATIKADAIWADIETNRIGRGDMKELIVNTGDFVGSLKTSALQGTGDNIAAITIAGDLDADVTISNPGSVKRPVIIGGEFSADRVFKITRDLKAEAPITLAANGLKGFIIINSGNGTDTWVGDITVGTTTLSPEPHYTQGMASLGGGAVGEARFGFHETDSEPDHNSTVMLALPTQVVIEHYGPVHKAGLGSIITIESRAIGNPTWGSPNDQFIVDCSSAPSGLRTDIIIKPKAGSSFRDDTEYRIKANAGKLKCCHVDGNPDVLWQGTYYQFTINLN